MQYSTNYNLNIVEGTDIVNPLVIDKPNYIAIDAQMKLNEDAGVGTATEIKTGTVHALTRANGDNNTFRFVSTSVFNSGDTFTVDGVSVTALLPSGEALPDAAYAIGCNVLCILTSTELTVFTAKTTANDSALLNGEPGSFYTDSTNIDYDNTLSGLTATDVKGAIDEVASDVNTINNNLTTGWTVINSNLEYCVRANIVFIKINNSTAGILGNIPSGYRPPIAIYVYNKIGANYCEGYIDTSGDVHISDTTVGWLTTIISYPLTV